MKLKLTEDGKAAVVVDGKPVFVHDDGKEVPFDAVTTVATINRLNTEAKTHRESKEAAELKLKGFEGIEDPAAAIKALETVKNIKDGEAQTAEKIAEIKAAARRTAEEQVAAANKVNAEALKAAEIARDAFRTDLYNEKIGGGFTRSKFVQDKLAIPPDMVQARFGQQFKVEEGKIVAYDHAGNKVFSRSAPGEVADFDEALDIIVGAYPYRDQILKGTGSRGDGKTPNNGGGGGAKTITRAEYDRDPMGAAVKMREGYTVVDPA